MKKMIYVAAPYSAAKLTDVVRNVQKAISGGEAISQMGHHALIPHLCHMWEDEYPHPYDFWIELTMAYMLRCDAVYAMCPKGVSNGVDGEIAKAEEIGMPVFFSLDELEEYLNETVAH